MEYELHDLGYDVFSIPKVHYSERRRLMEGKRIRGEMKQARQQQAQAQQSNSFEHERRSLKEQAKANAIREYKEERGLV